MYVVDMIITGNDTKKVVKLQKQLAAEFEMKSLGMFKYFLGIEVVQSKQGIFLSQRKYTLDLLSKFGLLDCKSANVPIQQNHRLGEYPDQIPTDKGRYQRLVGKLIYISHTRLNIAYVVNVVSQFMHCPSEDHMNAVTEILRYLKGTLRRGIMFSKNGHLEIMRYTNVD